VFRSFRLQLTAWYVLFFTLLLAGFSGFLYFLLARNLHARVDNSLESSVTTVSTLLAAELEELGGNSRAAAGEIVQELRLPSAYVAVHENGRLLDCAEPLRNTALPLATGISTLHFGAHGARIAVRPFHWKAKTFTIAVVEPLDVAAGQLEALRHVFYFALPLAILIAGLGGFLLASKSIAPVVSTSEQAEAITDKNLHTRLQAEGARLEFARLTAVFNELLSRLDRSFERMRDFMADASHELRTPLSIIRGEADVALAHNRQPAEYRESLAIIQDEARRLTRLVEDLLNLARADAGHDQLQPEEIYLNDVLEECCRSAQAQARQKGVRLVTPENPDVALRGDAQLLLRLISNLVDNAIRYTPAGGQVEAKLEKCGGQARLTIADTGVGIPTASLDKIFERFYRVEKSRTRAEGGFGLGLSIVKWIVDAHQGQIRVESRPNEGTVFTVLLPVQMSPAPHRALTEPRP
jgi:two-component system, OmpR family, sensor kinase